MEIELVQGRENGSEEINEQSVGVAAQPKTRFIHLGQAATGKPPAKPMDIYFVIALTIYPLGKWITLTFIAIKDTIYLPQR